MPRLCAFFNTCPYRASVPPPRARLASPVPAGWLGPVEASGGVAPAPRLPVSSPVLSTSAIHLHIFVTTKPKLIFPYSSCSK